MMKMKQKSFWRCIALNGIRPAFLENTVLPSGYYEVPDPYKVAPVCNVNLLELSRYAKRTGKKLVELSKDEIEKFSNLPA